MPLFIGYFVFCACVCVQGLVDLFHADQPSLSLVSNGAQCIVIHKRLYLDHAPLTLLSTLAMQVTCVVYVHVWFAVLMRSS